MRSVTVLCRVTLAIKVAYITVSVHRDTPPPHYTVVDSVSHNDFVSLFLFTFRTALLLFHRHLPRFLQTIWAPNRKAIDFFGCLL